MMYIALSKKDIERLASLAEEKIERRLSKKPSLTEEEAKSARGRGELVFYDPRSDDDIYPPAIYEYWLVDFGEDLYSGDISLEDILYGSKVDVEVKEIDFSRFPKDVEITMYVGGTGCGKTYKAIKESESCVIAVPTRQLAYEIALDYPEVEELFTGEVHLPKENAKKAVAVFENLSEDLIDRYDTLIVDEAHFLNEGDERSGALLEKIIYAAEKGKKIVFLTATDSFSEKSKEMLNIRTIELQPWKRVEKIKIEDEAELYEKAKEVKSILVFTKYKPDEDTVAYYVDLLDVDPERADFISADVPTLDRVKKQVAFKKGENKLMVSSNVLAQGVNFPAELVIIEYNEYDSWELIDQKIGRAGRPQYSNRAYYYLQFVETPEKYKKRLSTKKVQNKVRIYRGIFVPDTWGVSAHEIPTCFDEYSGYKYSKRFLSLLKEKGIANKDEIEALAKLEKHERELAEYIQEKLKERA